MLQDINIFCFSLQSNVIYYIIKRQIKRVLSKKFKKANIKVSRNLIIKYLLMLIKIIFLERIQKK